MNGNRDINLRRPTERSLRFALFWHELKPYLPVALAAALLIAGLTYVTRWNHSVKRDDLRGSVLQKEIGVVTRVTPYIAEEHIRPKYLIVIELDRGTTQTTVERPPREGDRVLVTYRVGRSGHLYVERVEPVGEKGPRSWNPVPASSK